MTTFNEKVSDFLAQKHIAVAGLARDGTSAANGIYKRLKELGYTVYAINPHTATIEGDPCYPSVQSLPQRPDAVMIVTRPEATLGVVEDCAAAGVTRVWMHESLMHGGTSVSQAALDYCAAHNISVIEVGCPLMFAEPVDIFHRCMRWMMRVGKQMPRA